MRHRTKYRVNCKVLTVSHNGIQGEDNNSGRVHVTAYADVPVLVVGHYLTFGKRTATMMIGDYGSVA